MGGLQLEVCQVRRIDASLSETHRVQAIQVPSLLSAVFAKWSLVSAHEETLKTFCCVSSQVTIFSFKSSFFFGVETWAATTNLLICDIEQLQDDPSNLILTLTIYLWRDSKTICWSLKIFAFRWHTHTNKNLVKNSKTRICVTKILFTAKNKKVREHKHLSFFPHLMKILEETCCRERQCVSVWESASVRERVRVRESERMLFPSSQLAIAKWGICC